MNVVLSPRLSALVWQLASKTEARKNALRHGHEVKALNSISPNIPTATTLLSTLQPATELALEPPSYSERELLETLRAFGLEGHAAVTAFRPSLRRTNGDVPCSLVSIPVDELALAKLTDGVFVLPPAACLVYAAQSLDLIQLILLGSELCSPFVRDPLISIGFETRPALLSLQDIQSLIEAAPGIRGIQALKKARPWIVPGSESPRESCLALSLLLPRIWGGYHLAGMEANYPISLGPQASKVYEYDSCRGDIVFPCVKLVLEYDSDLFHSGNASRHKDSRRAAALAIEGYEVISVTSAQVGSVQQMDGLAQLVSQRTGCSLRTRVTDYAKKKAQLQQSLLRRRDWYF